MMHSKVPAEQLADYSSGWKSSYWEPLERYFAESKGGLASGRKTKT